MDVVTELYKGLEAEVGGAFLGKGGGSRPQRFRVFASGPESVWLDRRPRGRWDFAGRPQLGRYMGGVACHRGRDPAAVPDPDRGQGSRRAHRGRGRTGRGPVCSGARQPPWGPGGWGAAASWTKRQLLPSRDTDFDVVCTRPGRRRGCPGQQGPGPPGPPCSSPGACHLRCIGWGLWGLRAHWDPQVTPQPLLSPVSPCTTPAPRPPCRDMLWSL